MTQGIARFVGQSASALAAMVHLKTASPTEIVRAHLDQIAAVDGHVGAFQLVRAARALAEAEALGARVDVAQLPLAGVPIAIKDNVAVAGEPMRIGSVATSERPRPADDEVVRRLRAAGAIVVGKTRVPELCAWATTDGRFGTTRNPWSLRRTPGGSSGGSAAAVAAAMVPVALGNDALGSIRIPAACCGLFGMKPGTGVVPSSLGVSGWFGMAENGPLATTVDDAALMLSVLADRADLGAPTEPDRSLRIAVSTRAPLLGVRVDKEFAAAAHDMGKALEGAGHSVAAAEPPYSIKYGSAVLARWLAGVADDAAGLSRRKLEHRTRAHARTGAVARWLGLIKAEDRLRWRLRLGPFFSRCDLLITPALATVPPPVDRWSQRSWITNLWANINYAPFAAPWNLAGYPAACVPAGMHAQGVPLSIQLVSTDGNESLILSVAKQLERVRPWPRHASLANV